MLAFVREVNVHKRGRLAQMSWLAASVLCSTRLLAQSSALTGPESVAVPPCDKVCWFAPAECPTEAEVQLRIAEHQSPNPDGTKPGVTPALGLTARVSRVGSGFELVLTRTGRTRVIRSADCGALADAAALVVALSRGDDLNWPEGVGTPWTDGSNAAAAAATFPQEPAPNPMGSTESSLPPPATPPVAAPAQPTAVVTPSAASPVPADEGAERVQLELPRPAEIPTPTAAPGLEVPITPKVAWISEPTLAVGGLIDPWLFPKVGPGVRVNAGLQLGTYLEAHVVGSWIPTVTETIEGTALDVEYSYIALGAQLCSSVPKLPALAGCAAFELANISAFAPGLVGATRRTVLSPSPGLGVHWVPDLGSFLVDLGIEAWFPFRTDVFTVNAEHETLHKIPAVTARLSLLVGYKF